MQLKLDTALWKRVTFHYNWCIWNMFLLHPYNFPSSSQRLKTECFCGMVLGLLTGLASCPKVCFNLHYLCSIYHFRCIFSLHLFSFKDICNFFQCNFYAITKFPGLRIAPPEAPVTGYMFGKGVYFADMFSKSANYCCSTPSARNGVLLLCEVIVCPIKKQ